MIINKILNNNVIVTIDKTQREVIAMGKGIAYKKKIGDEIEDTSIDKIYALFNKDISNKFQVLLADMPLEYIKIGDEIISYAKMNLGKKLSESIYISLSDHVHMAIERFLEGVSVKNALLWDIKRFYRDEFSVGLKALEMIKERFNVELNEDEAGFIALHIVNAELDEDIKNVYEITKVMQEISNIVKYYFSLEFDEESVYYYRFITHLKFFAQRLCSDKTYREDHDDDLLDIIKIKYKNAYECVEKIGTFIQKKYHYEISNEEKLYLTIHIARVVYKQ